MAKKLARGRSVSKADPRPSQTKRAEHYGRKLRRKPAPAPVVAAPAQEPPAKVLPSKNLERWYVEKQDDGELYRVREGDDHREPPAIIADDLLKDVAEYIAAMHNLKIREDGQLTLFSFRAHVKFAVVAKLDVSANSPEAALQEVRRICRESPFTLLQAREKELADDEPVNPIVMVDRLDADKQLVDYGYYNMDTGKLFNAFTDGKSFYLVKVRANTSSLGDERRTVAEVEIDAAAYLKSKNDNDVVFLLEVSDEGVPNIREFTDAERGRILKAQ